MQSGKERGRWWTLGLQRLKGGSFLGKVGLGLQKGGYERSERTQKGWASLGSAVARSAWTKATAFSHQALFFVFWTSHQLCQWSDESRSRLEWVEERKGGWKWDTKCKHLFEGSFWCGGGERGLDRSRVLGEVRMKRLELAGRQRGGSQGRTYTFLDSSSEIAFRA